MNNPDASLQKGVQDRFIKRVAGALGNAPGGRENFSRLFPEPPTHAVDALNKHIGNRSQQQILDLIAHLKAKGEPINLQVITIRSADAAGDAIFKMIQEHSPEWGDEKSVAAWDHPLIHSLNLKERLAEQGIPLFFTLKKEGEGDSDITASTRDQVVQSFIGITSADYCLADTGTLVMKAGPGQARSVSLVPSIHIAVIRKEQILLDLSELYGVLRKEIKENKKGLPNVISFISGPSKTADIELVMVHGAHGPRRVCIFVITE